MAVVSIIILESIEQIISGIPRSVSISTNIASTIFYTLDGTDPDLFSTIYTGTIILPETLDVILKVFATNGVDSSPIITEIYSTNILNNTRLPHSATTADPESNLPGLYPYGTNPNQPTSEYLNPAEANMNVDDPSLTEIPSAYDGAGNPTAFTNKEYNTENYDIIYSTTDYQGQTGQGIGNLPGIVTLQQDIAPPEASSTFNKLFDPRAMVVFHDVSKENPDEPPIINRQFFTIETSDNTQNANNFYTSGLDSHTVTGTFLRMHYNPRDNTMTYYYMDRATNKWIISKAPYQQIGTFDGNLAGVICSRTPGSRFVQEWTPFARRILF
jgi:hypothetical protein